MLLGEALSWLSGVKIQHRLGVSDRCLDGQV